MKRRSTPLAVYWLIKNVLDLDSLLKAESAKTYFEGTHRAVSPEATWERMRPLLPVMGITRLANVTGLDQIGIPVYMCCRPNSRSLAVSQGKGMDNISAKVSAFMESAETWHAECNHCVARIESHSHLKNQAAVCDPDLLPQRKASLFSRNRPIPWVLGADLLSNEPIWVPYELVHANATAPAVPGSGCFVPSTNGLASGNNALEAILHGLYEVIERDALALWELATPNRWSARRLDCSTIDDPACRRLLMRYKSAGVGVMVWEISSDVGLPVFVTIISDEEGDSVLRPIPAAFGSGCHSERSVALSRALTEAAQSRLTAITGSRDDKTRSHYDSSQSEAAIQFFRQLARESCAPVDFTTAPTFAAPTLAEDLLHVLECLKRISIERVAAVDLSNAGFPVSVVRVVVPGLEGPIQSGLYQPGLRVRSGVSWKQ
jgi:YcaO-like protein with predicted kinase domain